MSEWRVTFHCRLSEDMHAGSGLGWLGLIDDCQARDVQGRPVVWSSTLVGLLRDVADELHELSQDLRPDDSLRRLATLDRIGKLFGAEGMEARAKLVARSLHFARKTDTADFPLPATHLVSGTAREVHSRRPLDGTLRTVEVAAAGLVADGELRFLGDETDLELVKLCLQRLPSLGGGKSRGMGQVEISQVRVEPMPDFAAPNAAARTPQDSPANACRLRLVLRNLEPLCLALTGFPGNIIHSESYLPGQALRGALLTAFSSRGVAAAEVEAWASPENVTFENGYFVPQDLLPKDRAEVGDLSVLPLPLTAEQVKATEAPTEIAHGPWWSQPSPPRCGWLADAARERDNLQPEVRKEKADGQAAGTVKFKRIKAEDYLVGIGDQQPLRRVRPKLDILMRNRTPVVRVDRRHDSRRPGADAASLKEEVGGLFAQTVLAEAQLFVAEIRFADADLARRFVSAAAAVLSGKLADRTWLRVGRGGRPVRVERCVLIGDDPVPQLAENADSFTLTLTSDLIVRHDDLTFRTTLDGDSLASLAGIPDVSGRLQVDTHVSVSETRVVHGFNTAAGTRRAPALAVKRGSAFLVHGSDRGVLKRVFDALAAGEAKGRGLGERQEDGFGRFALNHRAHVKPPVPKDKALDMIARSQSENAVGPGSAGASKAAPRDVSVSPDSQRLARQAREHAIEEVLQAVKGMNLRAACGDKGFPSRGQWQRLRHDIEAGKTPDDLIRELKEHSQKHSGRMWNFGAIGGQPSLIQQIDKRRGRLSEEQQQRTFLIYLSRWVVVRLDQLRREAKG